MNELAVHPKGDYLAAADDSGTVKVYTIRTRKVDKTLRNAHTVSKPSLASCDGGSWHLGVEILLLIIACRFRCFPINLIPSSNRPTLTNSAICLKYVSIGLFWRVL